MGGWTDRRMDGWVSGRTNRWNERQMVGWTGGRVGGQVDGWMDRQADRWVGDGSTDECTDGRVEA